MAYAWFICQYKIQPNRPNVRFCAMNDFNALITADSGSWSESEILGGYAVVKVKANAGTLTTIGATANFYRITNHFVLADSLADLTTGQRTAISTRLLAMGYTQAEINAAMGSTLALWRQKTFVTLLNFMAQRRLKPRWDEPTQQIILDGEFQSCKLVTQVDIEVP